MEKEKKKTSLIIKFFIYFIIILILFFGIVWWQNKKIDNEKKEERNKILKSDFFEGESFIISAGYLVPYGKKEDYITKNKVKKVFLECVIYGKPKGQVAIDKKGCSLRTNRAVGNRLNLYVKNVSNQIYISSGFFYPEYNIIINNQEELVAEFNDSKNKHLLKINKKNKEVKLVFENKGYQKRELILKKILLKDL